MVGRIRYLCTMLAANKYPMQHEIIEDHSPFYIKFTHPGQAEIIDLCRQELAKIAPVKVFRHHAVNLPLAREIIALVPLSRQMVFMEHRVSLFVAAAGYRHEVHIDPAPVSINYGVLIQDDLCETRWYSAEDIESNLTVKSNDINRAIIDHSDFAQRPQQPQKSLRMQQGEAVIFNSSKYHAFDNSQSPHPRCILTLRLFNKNTGFDSVTQTMFGAKS